MKRERIIYATILILAGAILINLVRSEADMAQLKHKRFWIYKTHSGKEFPVIFGGDSRVYRGISPEDFESEFPGMKGINLGYSSMGYHPEYMEFLEQRLDRESERQLIVLGISAHPFTTEGMEARNFFWERDGRKKEEIIQFMHFYNLNRWFVPFDLLELAGLKKKKRRGSRRVIHHANGWMESHHPRPDTNFYTKRYSRVFLDNEIEHEGTAEFLKKVREWSGQGIMVVGYRTPASHTLHHLEDSLSDFDVDEFSKQFREMGGHWIEVDRRNYQTYDGNHLDNESAIRFTRDLAREIRKLYPPHRDSTRRNPAGTR